VIPVASTGLKQTIQVVTASNPQLRQTTPIQGKPITGAVRRSFDPGPNPSSGTSPSVAASGSTVAAGTNPGVSATSASTLNLVDLLVIQVQSNTELLIKDPWVLKMRMKKMQLQT